MHIFHVKLTPNQAKKLVQGKVVQLKNSSLLGPGGSGNWVALLPHTYKKAMKARKSGKGMRLQLAPEEISASGEGLWDLIKKGAKWLGEQYQKHIKPVVGPILKEGLKDALLLGEAAVGSVAPEALPFVEMARQKYGDKAIDWLGSKTGAFGLYGGYAGPLLPINHPAMHPLYNMSPGLDGERLKKLCPKCVKLLGGMIGPSGSFRAP